MEVGKRWKNSESSVCVGVGKRWKKYAGAKRDNWDKRQSIFFHPHSGLGRNGVHEKSLTDGLSIRLGGEYRNRTDDLLHAMQAL